MSRRVVAAVDIGTSSGRVTAGVFDDGRIVLDQVHRFPNGVVEIDGHLRWEITALFEQVLVGLAALAARYPEVESIGIDTWSVDYGLLGRDGALLAQPIASRDPRTEVAVLRVHEKFAPADLFAINGLHFLPFNTIYQLAAEERGPLWATSRRIVLLPDLLAYWLTGTLRTELTNATTTGLVDVATGRWSLRLIDKLRIAPSMLPPLEAPGATRGTLLHGIAGRVGLPESVVVTTVGSHDTASAVVGVPATTPNFAFIACGTWSLVGLELDAPLVTPAAREANFTNEGGVDGRTLFLRNVGGLWLLQECMRAWADEGHAHDLATLLADAATLPPGPIFDVDDDAFIAPGDMPARIAEAMTATGHRAPSNPAEVTRCVIDSLAASYARAVRQAVDISGRPADVIHVVGGGSQHAVLCQATANTTGLPVVAGPVEATALGNVLVQARAIGAAEGNLDDLRRLIAASTELTRYEPW